MSNDRSRGAALAAPSSAEGESQHREPWYDRLLQALHLKPRDSLREGLEEALAEPDAGESGLTPLEAITAATSTAAAFLYRADELGSLRPGLKADVVVLRGNPAADIAALRSVDRVMVGGRWVDLPRYRTY